MIDALGLVTYDGSETFTLYSQPPPVPDLQGTKWALFDLDGWNNSEPVRAPSFDSPNMDGAVLDTFSHSARVLELHGGLLATSRILGENATRKLNQAFELRDASYRPTLRPLLVTPFSLVGVNGLLRLDVRRAGAIQWKPYLYGKAWEFSVPLIAPDPRKIAPQQHITLVPAAGVALVAYNDGDTPSWAEMIITGPITNPIVTHDRTGEFVRFNGVLGAGQSVGFNTKDHTAGGSLGRADVDVTSEWFPMLPGRNAFTLTGSGTTSATKLELFWSNTFQ